MSDEEPRPPEATAGGNGDREFGLEGWLLVAATIVSFVAVPIAIALWPPGVGYRLALLILPLGPAVGLATIATWVALRG